MELENGKNRYELKAGDTVYSTPASLPMYREPKIESNKITSLEKGSEILVYEVFDSGWSYVHCDFTNGYVLSEGLSNINPLKKEQDGENIIELSREELISRLSYDMDISEPSGLSLEQFRAILQGKPSDKNKIFENNCDYFYYAEQEYGINGVFLASLAIHESGWGTSRIALDKNNLFGYQAYDGSAYNSAKVFSDYSEGIDLVARVLMKYYLNSNGTSIYGGDIADGRYFTSPTIKGVNKYYASDPNWASSIYKIMTDLYNDL